MKGITSGLGRNARVRWIVGAGVFALTAGYERLRGRVWWCGCGGWNPVCLDVGSRHNSQHLVDPYSLTHVLHGVILYWVLRGVAGRVPEGWRVVVAAALEGIWEGVENSPWIIERYRGQAAAAGYTGDSIANSMGDIACMLGGYWLGRKVGGWGSVALVVGVELMLWWWIRDCLTLSALRLIWPSGGK